MDRIYPKENSVDLDPVSKQNLSAMKKRLDEIAGILMRIEQRLDQEDSEQKETARN